MRHVRLVRLGLVPPLLLLGSATLTQAQLVNGDFETDPPDPSGFGGATGWNSFNFASTSDEFARSGTRAFKLFGPFFFGGGSGATQNVAVQPGQFVTLDGWGFTPTTDRIRGNNFAIMQLEFIDAANNVLGSSVGRIDATTTPDTWTNLVASGTAPTGTTAARALLVHVQVSDPVQGGAVWFDDIAMGIQPVINSTWNLNGNGDWFAASNWQGGVPNGTGVQATLGTVISQQRTITANANATVGRLVIDSPSGYRVQGTGTLTLDALGSGGSAIEVRGGSHELLLASSLLDDTTVSVAPTGALRSGAVQLNGNDLSVTGGGLLVLGGAVSGGAGATVRVGGNSSFTAESDLGPVVLDVASGSASLGATQRLGALSLGAGATVTALDRPAPAVIRTPSVTLAATAAINLTDNAMIVDHDGTTPFTDLRDAVISGAAGNSTGPGIRSSTAAGNPALGIGVVEASSLTGVTSLLGEAFDTTSVLLRVTLKGDTNLDGTVGFNDLVSLAQAYNGAGTWINGDSNNDDAIDFADLVALAQNYGGTLLASGAVLGNATMQQSFQADWARALAAVPEPATLGALAATGLLVLRRRAARA